MSKSPLCLRILKFTVLPHYLSASFQISNLNLTCLFELETLVEILAGKFPVESILNKANWDFEDFQSLLGRWMTQKFNKPIRDCDLEVPNKSSAFCSKSCEVIGLPLAYPSRYLVTRF